MIANAGPIVRLRTNHFFACRNIGKHSSLPPLSAYFLVSVFGFFGREYRLVLFNLLVNEEF